MTCPSTTWLTGFWYDDYDVDYGWDDDHDDDDNDDDGGYDDEDIVYDDVNDVDVDGDDYDWVDDYDGDDNDYCLICLASSLRMEGLWECSWDRRRCQTLASVHPVRQYPLITSTHWYQTFDIQGQASCHLQFQCHQTFDIQGQASCQQWPVTGRRPTWILPWRDLSSTCT